MDETGDRLVAECEAQSDRLHKSKDKKSRYKKACIHVQGKLRRTLERLETPQVEHGQSQDALAAKCVECDRLHNTESNRGTTLHQMRVKLSDSASERDRVIQDHITLRDRMALLVPDFAYKVGIDCPKPQAHEGTSDSGTLGAKS
ncbi:unnamed protein product [Peronospora destructor]|uniref:Uncharacterized protein n=1 Tax=Peronospora destructor TaxID=86335 RepID=A0AAV0TA10_9STRA|nr:unnamed protein product [Peronospora destructor]